MIQLLLIKIFIHFWEGRFDTGSCPCKRWFFILFFCRENRRERESEQLVKKCLAKMQKINNYVPYVNLKLEPRILIVILCCTSKSLNPFNKAVFLPVDSLDLCKFSRMTLLNLLFLCLTAVNIQAHGQEDELPVPRIVIVGKTGAGDISDTRDI